MTQDRLIWADSLKGWLMILVVIGHAIQVVLGDGCNDDHLWNLIYSFHMPAFMAVSGWFAYRHGSNRIGYLSICKRRCYQLLIPYLLWSIIKFALSRDYGIDQFSSIILYPDKFFWFLWVLFWINIFFIMAQFIADKFKVDEIKPIICCCALLISIMVCTEFRKFGFQFIAYYFAFYTLGYCIHRYTFLQINNSILLFALTFLWACLGWFWKMHTLPLWFPRVPHLPESFLQYLYRGLSASVAILVLTAVAPKILNSNNKFNIGIEKVGYLSLGIYTCHLLLMGYVLSLLQMILPGVHGAILIALLAIISYIISLSIVCLLLKGKYTAEYLLGKI